MNDPYAGSFGASPTPVNAAHTPAVYDTSGTTAQGPVTKGEQQPTRCRDPIFAVLLYVNVIAMAAVAILLGRDVFGTATTGGFDYTGYLYTVALAGVVSILLSFLMMLVMMRIPTLLIKASLIFVVALSGVLAAITFLTGNLIGGIIGLVFFALGICYACAVWERIPFASANLLTATTAVKNNCGVTIQAILSVVVAFGWSLLWTIALLGVWDRTYNCTTDANGVQTCSSPSYGILFVLFLSYFFTHQVIQNTLVVIVAGVVGEFVCSFRVVPVMVVSSPIVLAEPINELVGRSCFFGLAMIYCVAACFF